MYTYIAVHLDDKDCVGGYPHIGYWMNYFVYEIPNHVLPRMRIQGVSFIPMERDVAFSWKFASSVKDHIKVMKGENSLALSQIGEDNPNLEEHNEYKYKYFLTDEDYKNTTKFIQLIALEELRRGFNIIWARDKPRVPDIYIELFQLDGLISDNVSDRILEYKNTLYKKARDYEEVENIILSSTTIAEAFDSLTVVIKTINPELDV